MNRNLQDINRKNWPQWRERMHEIIFEADTPEGKAFDVALLWAIFISVLAVVLESVAFLDREYGTWLRWIEWGFTAVFTVEYVARVLSVRKPLRYMTSFYGIVDLLSIIPTYVSLFVMGSQTLLVIRVIRLLRVFRIFKLARYLGEAKVLVTALKASRHKITVFLGFVVSITVIIGTLMYLIEGRDNGFTSIPKSIYWAIVTLTTVGYGDISPQTPLGQFLASCVMVLGYGVLAVPTGIVSVEIAHAQKNAMINAACPGCGKEGHEHDASFCKYCGTKL
ncbi:ion transporter [Rapidithrix thailandica]|uniref:Ion transporter n=1 Tax=Rapidithrix thailandica TaxID=413964 RepID=A0AAW9SB76_9BACT